MSNRQWFETEPEFVPCDDCVDADNCLTLCKVQETITEDVAKIRGEVE
jgi:hypothetical protein